MLNKLTILILTFLIFNLALSASPLGETGEDKAAKEAEKVRIAVVRLGTGEHARVEVKLRDKTSLKGYVSKVGDTSFSVIEDKTGIETEIPYTQTRQVKGNNLSTGVKIAIVVGIILAIGAILGACCAQ